MFYYGIDNKLLFAKILFFDLKGKRDSI